MPRGLHLVVCKGEKTAYDCAGAPNVMTSKCILVWFTSYVEDSTKKIMSKKITIVGIT